MRQSIARELANLMLERIKGPTSLHERDRSLFVSVGGYYNIALLVGRDGIECKVIVDEMAKRWATEHDINRWQADANRYLDDVLAIYMKVRYNISMRS